MIRRNCTCGMCKLCDRYDNDPRYRRAVAVLAPCRHLGPATGERVLCPTCPDQLGVKLKLFRCDQHGDCTPADLLPGKACCRTCPDYTLASRTVSIDPPRPDRLGLVAFNATALDLGRGFELFAYRLGWAGGRLAACLLDSDHRPQGEGWILEHPRLRQDGSGREDPRIFRHHGIPHVSYVGLEILPGGKLVTHQCLMRLSVDGRRVEYAWHPHYPDRALWEKNWGFFSHEGELFAVYSISPHRVLRIEGAGASLVHEESKPLHRPAGLLRGGSPPVRIGDEYYSWFHGKRERGPESEYWVGLYTFEARPPFRPTRSVRQSLLDPRKSDRPSNQVPHCVFPGGAFLRDGKWVVAYGYYDHQCRIAEFDATLIESLLEVIP